MAAIFAACMTPQIFHDTLGMFTKGLPVMIGAVAMVVLGSLLWSEAHSGARPEGCARQPRSSRSR
jgi:hypothetical protein